MTTQQQESQPDTSQQSKRGIKHIPWMRLLIVLIAVVLVIVVGFFNLQAAIIAIPVFSLVIALFQWLFPVSNGKHDHFQAHTHSAQTSQNIPMTPTIQPIIVHVPVTQPLTVQPSPLEKPSHRGIAGIPPPTDPRTIQQREPVVQDVYEKITRPGITAIALTGIGGIGKSTLAALVYHYTEEQRLTQNGPFQAEALWFTVDPVVTFADLAGNLFDALGKPMPDLGNLAPQNQAVALFNALNTTETPRLVIIDQFENLLDWNTGHALADRPGVGEWLDMLNSQQCNCRILLTSRPRPVGTHEYPPTFLQEYPVEGLKPGEGIALLRSQGVQGTDEELQSAVTRCSGHAFSLMLLASLLRDHHLNLATLFKHASLWTGDIAANLLDQIYRDRLNDVQRELLLAFSVYREPVPLEAAQAIITNPAKGQFWLALKALRTEHLLEAIGEGSYQLHAIVEAFTQTHFDESSEQANEEALRGAHARAAQYYLEQAEQNCPPREQRRKISDVHDLIEVLWQLCQAGQWQEAYDVMEVEGIFDDLKRWGGNPILLELYQLLLTLTKSELAELRTVLIYINLGRVQRTLGYYLQAQQHLELALSISRARGYRKEEGTALSFLGRVYAGLGQKERARLHLLEALSIRQEIEDRRGEGWTLDNLGRVYADLGQKEVARQYCEKALIVHHEVGDREGEGTTLNHLGMIHDDLGKKEKALSYYEQALQISREVGDRGGEGATLNNIGRVYNVLGGKETALNYYERALVIHKEVGDRIREGVTLSNIGRVYFALDNRERAFQYSEQSLKIFKDVGDRGGEARVLNNISSLYDDLGNNRVALSYLEQAFAIFKEIGDRGGEGTTLNNVGRIYKAIGKLDLALEYYVRALQINQEVEDRGGEGVTLHNIGTIFLEQEKYEVSLALFLLARKVFEEVQSLSREVTQRYLERMQSELGEERFAALLASVEPKAQQIVDQALLKVESTSDI